MALVYMPTRRTMRNKKGPKAKTQKHKKGPKAKTQKHKKGPKAKTQKRKKGGFLTLAPRRWRVMPRSRPAPRTRATAWRASVR